jgi:hypothetical protein
MLNQIRPAALYLSIGVFGIVGCTEGNAVNTAATQPPTQIFNPGVPPTPETAVKAVLDGLKASKPVVVWDAMPVSRQGAFNQMVRDLASTADPEIWKRTVVNLKKVAQLADTKKDFILQSPLVRSVKGIKLEDVKACWAPGLKLFKMILESELVDQEKMKNFDGRAFLEGTGAKLFAQARELSRSLKDDPLKQIDGWNASVQTLPDHTSTAVVDLGGPKKKTMEIPLVVQEGKWTTDRFTLVSFLVADRMNRLITSFRPYYVIEWKDKYLADMRRIERALDQLQAAKTSDDFQAVVSLQVLPYVVQKTLQFSKKAKPVPRLEAQSQSRPMGTAMVLVKGDHFADEPGMLELVKVLRAVAAEGKGALAGPSVVQEMTVFFVNPVTDTDALSKKIHVGKITKIDVRRNKIVLELPVSPPDDKATANADGAKAAH